jgi:hypothetical protein
MVDTNVRPEHLAPSCRNEFLPFCHATLLSEPQPNAVRSLREDNLWIKAFLETAASRSANVVPSSKSPWV